MRRVIRMSPIELLSIWLLLLRKATSQASISDQTQGQRKTFGNFLDFEFDEAYVDSKNDSREPSTEQKPTGSPTPFDFVPRIAADEETLPSTIPSDMPSLQPSRSSIPSSSPTPEPTASSEPTLSALPTAFPSATFSPSSSPSTDPSELPTTFPTFPPSLFPSPEPSFSPTFKCHDNNDYQSPINNLPCKAHQNTECINWRFLGLNLTELDDLISNCPESCGIECGWFQQFSSSANYHLTGISGFLDENSKTLLEEATFDFIEKYVQGNIGPATFGLYEVTLISQNLYEPGTNLRRLNTERFEISLLFEGFAIGMRNKQVAEVLAKGIESSGYTYALRRSSDFFETANIPSGTEVHDEKTDPTNPPTPDEEGKRKKEPSRATVVIATLLVSSLIFALGTLFVHHQRSLKWLPQRKNRESLQDIEGNNAAGYPSPRSTLSPPGSLVSFDETRGEGGSNGFLRLMASISNGTTHSRCFTASDKSLRSPTTPSLGRDYGGIETIVSPISDGTDETEMSPEEHPLSNIFPPMIVIDHIDQDENDNASEVVRKNQQVPSRRVEASSAFVSSLTAHQKREPSSRSAGLWYNGSDFSGNLEHRHWSKHDEESRDDSFQGICVDSDTSDDELSTASTPLSSKTPRIGPLRRALSSSALDDLDRRETICSLSPPPSDLNASPSSDQPNLKPLVTHLHDLEEDGSFSFGMGTGHSPPLLSHSASVGSSEWNMPSFSSSAPALSVKDVDKQNLTCTFHELVEAKRSSARALGSPIPKGKGNSRLKRSSLPFALHSIKKKHQPNDAPEHSEDDKMSCKSPGRKKLDIQASLTVRLEFEAPRNGQLGLVVETSTDNSPRVHVVKDYSPLLGKLQKGDCIVEVDGKKTKHSSLHEITKLLAVKSNRRGSNGSIRIVVERPRDQVVDNAGNKDVAHSRENSYGSSTITSARIVDDLEVATIVDDLDANTFDDECQSGEHAIKDALCFVESQSEYDT